MMPKNWKMTEMYLAHRFSSVKISKSYLMNAKMTGFRWFSQIIALILMLWAKVASALGGLSGFIRIYGTFGKKLRNKA